MEHRYKDILIKNKALEIKWESFSSEEIEDMVRGFPSFATCQGTLDNVVENTRIPPLFPALAMFMQIYLTLPDANEFGVFYCYLYNKTVNHLDYTALKGRLIRSYPSILRDYHLTVKLQENLTFKNVLYSLKADLQDRIDISLEYKEVKIYLATLLNSKKALLMLERKKLSTPDDGHLIPVILIPKEEYKFGHYYLYTEEHIDRIMEEGEKISQKRWADLMKEVNF